MRWLPALWVLCAMLAPAAAGAESNADSWRPRPYARGAPLGVGTWGVVEAERRARRGPRPPRVCVCGEHAGDGRIPPESIRYAIDRNRGRLRGCYLDALFRDPELEGRVAIRFTIGRDGRAKVGSAEARGIDPPTVRCLARAFEAMAFPPAPNVRVLYPLLLSAAARERPTEVEAAPTFPRLWPSRFPAPLTLPMSGVKIETTRW
jgi:hypothetical protein